MSDTPVPSRYVKVIAASGKSIYDPIEVGDPACGFQPSNSNTCSIRH